MAGRLDGIARHAAPKGPMETVDHVTVTVAEGVHGDFRGGLASTKAGHKRQVSLIEAESVAEGFCRGPRCSRLVGLPPQPAGFRPASAA